MKKFAIRFLLVLLAIIALVAALIGIEYFGGQPMGLFAGSRPTNLGFSAGKFAPPIWKPNCVSSTVEKSDSHYIEPIKFNGTTAEAWNKLQTIVKASPRVNIVAVKPGYLYAEFKSAGMGFVDDVEFALDEAAGVVQVRSASRLGVRDLGVNRARIEFIRDQFSK
jgi:uncharacterized protein (DUF1499 family)